MALNVKQQIKKQGFETSQRKKKTERRYSVIKILCFFLGIRYPHWLIDWLAVTKSTNIFIMQYKHVYKLWKITVHKK